MLFSSFPCCQKAAPSLSMDCAARAAGVQGRAGEEPWRERPRRQGQPRGERCRMVRQAAARSCRPLWSGKSHVAQARRHRPSCCGWTGKRRPAHAWRNGYCRMGRLSRRALSSRRRLPLAERLGRYFDLRVLHKECYNDILQLRECPAYTLLYQFSPKDTG